MADRPDSLVSQIGGRAFLEPKMLLALTVPGSLIASVLAYAARTDIDSLLVVLANVAAFLGLAAVILFVRWVWLRRFPNHRFPLIAVLLISAALGALKGLLTGLALSPIAQTGDIDWEQSITGATIAGMLALPFASFAQVLLDEFQRRRNALLLALALTQSKVTSEDEATLLSDVKDGVASAISRARAGSRTVTPEELAFVRELVTTAIRPLSHSLFLDLSKKYQQFTLPELFRGVWASRPPSIGLGLLLLTSVPVAIERLGVTMGLLMALVTALLVGLTSWIGYLLLAKVPVNSKARFLVAGGMLPGLLAWWAQSGYFQYQTEPVLAALLNVVWIGWSAIVFAMARIALRESKANRLEEERLMNSKDSALALALHNRQRRELALKVHGDVQGRIYRLLSQAEGEQLQQSVMIAEMEEVLKLLEAKPAEQTLSENLAGLKREWSGFSEVHIGERFEANGHDPDVVFALVQEATGNAFRHGVAKNVWVSWQEDVLVVEDDGVGPTGGERGMGSALFDLSTDSWQLAQRDAGGSRLELKLRS